MKQLTAYIAVLWAAIVRGPVMLLWAQRYLDAWNRHDIDRIVAMTGAGEYADTLTRTPVKGEALARHLGDLFTAFPDLSLDLTGPITVGAGAVGARYRLCGTNTGKLAGDMGFEHLAPTGRTIDLAGSIFIEDPARPAPRISNHFLQHELATALGFQNLLLPRYMGDYDFGAFFRLKRGNFTPPEAIGITWLQLDQGEAEFQTAATITRQTLEDFARHPGFVTGIVGARNADESGQSFGFTLSAWESVDAMDYILESDAHKHAVQQFMKAGLAYGTHSRVYRLERTKPVMIACRSCGKKNNAHKSNHTCSVCKAELPEAPAHW